MPPKWDAVDSTLYVTPEQFDEIRPILEDGGLSAEDRNTAILRAGGMDDDLAFLALIAAGYSGKPITVAVREFRQ